MSDVIFREYWSTPIAEYQLDNEDLKTHVVDIINKEYDLGNEVNILVDGDMFLEWVYSCSKNYLSKFYKNDCEVELARSWVNLQKPLENLPIHSHAPIDFVGVYYINSTDNHPLLNIYDPRPPHKFNEVVVERNGQNVVDCARQISIKPKQGHLVLFPGYLMHGVDANLTRTSRQSLAMNFKIKNK